MAGTARSSFVWGMIFLTATLIFVILAFLALPTGGEEETCSISEMLSPLSMILDMVLGYIPTIAYAILAIGFGLFCFKKMKKFYSLWQASKPGPRFHFGLKQAIFLLIFILAFMPFILPLIDHGQNTKDHSIYNPYWNGCSNLREMLNTSSSTTGRVGYNVQGIESSLSATMRNNDTYKIIFLLGPNRLYNLATDIPFFIDFLRTGGSLFMCDDKGTTNDFIMDLAILSGLQTPFVEFPKGDLADNASYIPGENPHFPVIKSFEATHATTNTPWDIIGENKGVALNHASAILPFGAILGALMGGGEFSGEESGINVVGQTSRDYSYMDMNDDFYYDPNVDKWDPSFLVDFLASMVCVLTDEQKQELIDYASAVMLGNLPKTVFAASDLPQGRLFLSSDARFLNNQLLEDSRFSNAHFAENIFNWLSYGTSPNNITIYFDEYHIKQEGFEEFSSAYIYGVFIGYVNWMSSSAILAWLYPFIAISTLSRWLPKDPE